MHDATPQSSFTVEDYDATSRKVMHGVVRGAMKVHVAAPYIYRFLQLSCLIQERTIRIYIRHSHLEHRLGQLVLLGKKHRTRCHAFKGLSNVVTLGALYRQDVATCICTTLQRILARSDAEPLTFTTPRRGHVAWPELAYNGASSMMSQS